MNTSLRFGLSCPTLLVTALLPSVAMADQVDFEGLATGQILSSVNSAGGAGPILVLGSNPNFPGENAAVIFDSANPTGGDADLGTPNEDFNGPGVGSAGEQGSPNENNTDLGKILIIDESLVTDGGGLVIDPDDSDVNGSTIEFDFSSLGTVTMNSIDYIDVEQDRVGSVELFDAGNSSLGVFPTPALGDNGVGTLDLGDTSGVARMLITLGGSGGFTGFDFEEDCSGSIGDFVWLDLDGDGLQENGEAGIEGVRVVLTNAGGDELASTETGSDGSYLFTGLCAGEYRVVVDESTLPEGVEVSPCAAGNDPTIDNNCSPAPVVLSDNMSERRDIDFGYTPVPFVYCDSSANSTGLDARIDSVGSTSITTNDFQFVISNLPPNKPAYLFYGRNQAEAPFGDGVRCIGAPLFRYVKIPSTGATGEVVVNLDFTLPPIVGGPGQIIPGDPVYFQLWYRDPTGGPAGFNATGAMCVTFAP